MPLRHVYRNSGITYPIIEPNPLTADAIQATGLLPQGWRMQLWMSSRSKATHARMIPSLFRSQSSPPLSANKVAQLLRKFTFSGLPTIEAEEDGLRYYINEFWTSGQRQGHSLHEISYRACFKPQLPDFFISRLCERGDAVYDPFSGRGTTAVQAALSGRRPLKRTSSAVWRSSSESPCGATRQTRASPP